MIGEPCSGCGPGTMGGAGPVMGAGGMFGGGAPDGGPWFGGPWFGGGGPCW